MSDIYIPELIELGSFWQKAVEDAIYDTLKGKKRLYYALRNRKKINQKLESLGLKPVCSQMSFRVHSIGQFHFNKESKDDNQNLSRCKSVSNSTHWGSCCENSAISLGTTQHEYTLSQSLPEPKWESYSDVGSRSAGSEGCKQTPPDKKYRNPEKTLLGDGSVEKMKKSHNSFYCEPMGARESLSEEFYGSDKDDGENTGDMLLKVLHNSPEFLGDKNKTVKWLHVREDSFDDSDTDMSNNNNTLRKVAEKIGHQKQPTLIDVNYSINPKLNDGSLGTPHLPKIMTLGNEKRKSVLIPTMLDPQEDVFWENEVKNAIRESANLDRKLHFALAKREIVNEKFQFSRMQERGKPIHINALATKFNVTKGRSKRLLSPFVKFYLEVYRELCHKYPLKQITKEAAERWWGMSMNQKSVYGSKNNSN